MDNLFLESMNTAPKNVMYDIVKGFGRSNLSTEAKIYIISNMPPYHGDKEEIYKMIAGAVCWQKNKLDCKYNNGDDFARVVAQHYHDMREEKLFFQFLDRSYRFNASSLKIIQTIITRILRDKIPVNYERLLNDLLYWSDEKKQKWEYQYAREISEQKYLEENNENNEKEI